MTWMDWVLIAVAVLVAGYAAWCANEDRKARKRMERAEAEDKAIARGVGRSLAARRAETGRAKAGFVRVGEVQEIDGRPHLVIDGDSVDRFTTAYHEEEVFMRPRVGERRP